MYEFALIFAQADSRLSQFGSRLKFYRRSTSGGKRKRLAMSRCLTGRSLSPLGNALAGSWIKYSVSQELLSGPGGRIPSQISMKPFKMRGVVQGHLVPAGPMSGPGIDEQLRGDLHFLQRGEKFK